MPAESPPPSASPANQGADARPRAFATATGFAFQVVGVVFLVVSTAYWFVSGRVQTPAATPINALADYFAREHLVLTASTGLVLSGVGGGLAMIAFGLGLQGERRRSGIGAMIVAGALTVIGLAATAMYLFFGPYWLGAFVAVIWTAVSAVMFLLAGHSADTLRRHPPPEDQNVVDDAWIEAYHRKRRESRNMI
jgi:hypothetical protein